MTFQHILWPVLILIFIALPVIQLMPSPQQKLRAKLRETAMQSGLLVQFAKIPTAPPTTERAEAYAEAYAKPYAEQEEESGIAYRWQRPPEQKRQFKTHGSYRVGIQHDTGSCQWFNRQLAPADTSAEEALRKIFLQFPEDVSVVESSPTQISAYWRERGEVCDVEKIAECLRAIHAIELDAMRAKN